MRIFRIEKQNATFWRVTSWNMPVSGCGIGTKHLCADLNELQWPTSGSLMVIKAERRPCDMFSSSNEHGSYVFWLAGSWFVISTYTQEGAGCIRKKQ
jgi:hypothetical protein